MQQLKRLHAATLTAAIVTASGRAHSINEVLDLQRDIFLAENPAHEHGYYQEWLKTRDATLAKVRA